MNDCPMCTAGDSSIYDLTNCEGCNARHIARSPRGDATKMIAAYRKKHGDEAAEALKVKVKAEFDLLNERV